MHSVLDTLASKPDAVLKSVKALPEEQLDQLAVFYVAKFGWNRSEFFQHSVSARIANFRVKAHTMSDKEGVKKLYDELEESLAPLLEEFSSCPKEQGRLASPPESRVQLHMARTIEAVKGVRLKSPITPAEHLIEVQSMVAYNKAKNPEFRGPEGTKHLLAVRERFNAKQHMISSHEEKVTQKLSSRADYLVNNRPAEPLQPVAAKDLQSPDERTL
jgi:hypothetical protein